MLPKHLDEMVAKLHLAKIDVELEGDYTGAVGAPGYKAEATVDVPMPAIAEFSGYHRLTPQFALHYSVMWTDWSALKNWKPSAASATCRVASA